MVGKTFGNNGGSGTSEATSTVTLEKKEAAMEFAPHTSGKHQSVTHKTVKDHTMQKLQMEPRHGLDMVKCLHDGADNGILLTKPVRQTRAFGGQTAEEPVSYTHLTLPTICSV